MAELVPLPGIGRKTANVVLGHAYGVNEGIAVDTHVLRVSNRLGLANGDDPLKIEAQLMALVPRERWTRTTDLLIFHGRKVCDARRPACGACPLFALCRWESRQAWAAGRAATRPARRGSPAGARATRARRGRRAPRAAKRPAGDDEPPERAVAAVVQMTSTADVERNLNAADALVGAGGAAAARAFVGPARELRLPALARASRCPSRRTLDGPWVRRMAALARRLEITLLLGSLPERVARRHARAQHLGAARARRRDARRLPQDPPLRHRPARAWSTSRSRRRCCPGDEVVVADTPARPARASRSATTCASPSSTASSSRRGARVLCVPSAFTERTGKAHWEVLLRARAIENLAYVLAPAQVGHHGGGRASHGQAMIVDPWGAVVAQVPDGEGVALAELDFARLERLRRELPALSHVPAAAPAGA